MARIDRLLARQTERLNRLTDRQAAQMVAAFDEAAEQLRADLDRLILAGLDEATPWTAQRTRVALALVRQGVRDLRDRLGDHLDEATREQADQSMADLLEIIVEQEPEFLLTGSELPVPTLARITAPDGLALHRHSLDRYGRQTVDEIQKRLSASLATGANLRETIDAIDAVIDKGRSRAALIARMELGRSYNEAHLESIESYAEIADLPDDPVLKKIVEIRDGETERSHPASAVADDLTARPDEEFRLPVYRLLAEYRRRFPGRKRHKISGMVWERRGDAFYGQALPIHYNDRGRIVPWRASWATETADEAPPASEAEPTPPQAEEQPPTTPPATPLLAGVLGGGDDDDDGLVLTSTDVLDAAGQGVVIDRSALAGARTLPPEHEEPQARRAAAFFRAERAVLTIKGHRTTDTVLVRPDRSQLPIEMKLQQETAHPGGISGPLGRWVGKLYRAQPDTPHAYYVETPQFDVERLLSYVEGREPGRVREGEPTVIKHSSSRFIEEIVLVGSDGALRVRDGVVTVVSLSEMLR